VVAIPNSGLNAKVPSQMGILMGNVVISNLQIGNFCAPLMQGIVEYIVSSIGYASTQSLATLGVF
jgi:hypothetical protein